MSGILVLILRFLMTAILYTFLGWAIYTLWRDLRYHTQTLAARHIPELLLTPLDFLEGETATFNKPEVIVGRDPTCAFPIPNETVSARHARLSYHQNQWWIEDLNSTNGTFLNDEHLTTVTVVVSGDEVRCGQSTFRIEILPKQRPGE